MKQTRLFLSAAALTLVASAAMAQDSTTAYATPEAAMAATSAPAPAAVVVLDQRAPLSREDVKAEVQAARQDGSLARYDADSHVPDASQAPVSTADDEPESPLAVVVVTEQTLPAGAAHSKPVVFATAVSSATYYPVAIETSHPMTRDEVRADFREARQSGENSPFNPDPYVNSPMPETQE